MSHLVIFEHNLVTVVKGFFSPPFFLYVFLLLQLHKQMPVASRPVDKQLTLSFNMRGVSILRAAEERFWIGSSSAKPPTSPSGEPLKVATEIQQETHSIIINQLRKDCNWSVFGCNAYYSDKSIFKVLNNTNRIECGLQVYRLSKSLITQTSLHLNYFANAIRASRVLLKDIIPRYEVFLLASSEGCVNQLKPSQL